MKITFTETGGLIGKTKKATIDFPISAKEYKALLKTIALPQKKTGSKIRDGFNYFLAEEADEKSTPISIKNIPKAYNELFDKLFEALKIV